MKENMEDLVVDASGHCFFCLDKCLSKNVSPGVKSVSSHSLQYLSRYLKMNRKKIFNDEESIPPDLLAKVEKSRLTSELCEECGSLNKQFSKLFRNLEMTELRIASCLDRIHSKLLTADDTGKAEKFSNDEQSQSAANGKRKIVQALREEAMDNCSKRLNGIAPRIKLRKLKMKEIHQNKLNLKLKSHNRMTSHESPMNKIFSSEQKIKIDGSQEGQLIPNPNQYDDDDDEGHDMHFNDFNEEENEDFNVGMQDDSLFTKMTSQPDLYKSQQISYKGKFTKSNSGKYICKDCSKEYSTYPAFTAHYRGAHLKIRFRCVPCGKEFAQRVQFDNHQRSVHMRVRFKCDLCDVMSTTKTNLDRHRRSAHFGGRFPCQFCSMTFEKAKDRNEHMRFQCQSKGGPADESGNE